jgi:spermidine synthase
VEGDFFARIESDALDPCYPGKQFDALLLDIDHSPSDLLDPRNATFYSSEGLRSVNRHLRQNGIFAMWSDDPPDDAFHSRLDEAFDESRAHIVSFYNPLLDCNSASTVYVARARL